MTKNIVLASASPRRKEILQQVGISFEVCASDADETVDGTQADNIVMELSARKAQAARECYGASDKIFLGADTVVACEGKILGKPADEQDAYAMLQMLQGNRHEVYTGVTLLDGKRQVTFFEVTHVQIRSMTDRQIQQYIASKEPMDKAGAYGIQGAFAAYIEGIQGDYYNVVGLPIARVCQELEQWEVCE